MSPVFPLLKRLTQFSLASLVLFSLFSGAVMGVWVNRHEWAKANTIPLKGTCNYLRFNKSKLLAVERIPDEGIVGKVVDVDSGALLQSVASIDSFGFVNVGRFDDEGNVAQLRGVPMVDRFDTKKDCLLQGIIAPDDDKAAAFKWNDLDFVQFSTQFDLRKKNISLFEPRGIFYKMGG